MTCPACNGRRAPCQVCRGVRRIIGPCRDAGEQARQDVGVALLGRLALEEALGLTTTHQGLAVARGAWTVYGVRPSG